MGEKILFNHKELDLSLNRLCWQLIENHCGFENTVLIGMQPRGYFLAQRIQERLLELTSVKEISLGSLDITFFRDDFRRRDEPVVANQTDINFLVEGKNVIFIDDVLYTGRSIRAGMDAINSFGRPQQIELLVLIDRRFSRELPIEPNYVGKTVDAIDTEKVLVEWSDTNNKNDLVRLIRE
ncbi:bifunctional pyr operon transcriptional regulator/uracil phosphoribosyltransferase PyrR [Flavobacteriales bacterium]|jgi:pyrimidine operon attenuation protein/uracil phosphoribosyltransferase|nr:bifunctional pyr operon transcriptional regulator/uracil phosphoribosyltransferase PyrR [Flavobacteriales bacterium]MDA9003537.1 bifunctional pyr operon transcriptional regulator/uracil phosphoribosyltransferase PyrR [Flavobacteriales bacterium]MDG1146476.1 bifunctional pyr operon transcriptional regulator/uracil phosphoribosyltransferase PyrR [Flavobacteriales bacterium]MDG1395371.1 bifunctional pyr operon transcriptional regulator/uracil phosphoribosyltransferase PyrR [Flavobacteriales bact|tara:strand:+ start:1196 stop:1738 length:543 start_codon:yes stop_codon:yes gene_type:complete